VFSIVEAGRYPSAAVLWRLPCADTRTSRVADIHNSSPVYDPGIFLAFARLRLVRFPVHSSAPLYK